MAISYVAGYVKSNGECGQRNTENEKAGKVDLIQVFGVKKKIRYAQVLPEVSGDHRKQDDPAQHQHVVSPEVVEQQLQREGIPERSKKMIKPSHRAVRGFS